MKLTIEEIIALNPLSPRDQDRAAEVTGILAADGVSTYPDVLELVRNHGGTKEGAYSAYTDKHPYVLDEPHVLRLFMCMCAKAERELRASN